MYVMNTFSTFVFFETGICICVWVKNVELIFGKITVSVRSNFINGETIWGKMGVWMVNRVSLFPLIECPFFLLFAFSAS
jgi:hypothetical protein